MSTKKDPAAVALGKKGGIKTSKRGPDYYRDIGAKGNKAQGKKVGRKSKNV